MWDFTWNFFENNLIIIINWFLILLILVLRLMITKKNQRKVAVLKSLDNEGLKSFFFSFSMFMWSLAQVVKYHDGSNCS